MFPGLVIMFSIILSYPYSPFWWLSLCLPVISPCLFTTFNTINIYIDSFSPIDPSELTVNISFRPAGWEVQASKILISLNFHLMFFFWIFGWYSFSLYQNESTIKMRNDIDMLKWYFLCKTLELQFPLLNTWDTVQYVIKKRIHGFCRSHKHILFTIEHRNITNI